MDFSAVHLSGLPRGCTTPALIEILAQFGFTVAAKDIRLSHGNLQYTTFASIKIQDHAFAQHLCDTLSQHSNVAMTATSIPVPPFAESGQHRVDSSPVKFSWHKPTRTFWLNFSTQEVANRVRGKFLAGRYKICGTAFEPTPAKCAPQTGRGYNRQAWTIVINNVPADVTTDSVAKSILDHYDQPRHIQPGSPTYSLREVDAIKAIKSLVDSIGPIENSISNVEPSGKRFKLTVRFQDENDASRAAKELHDEKLPFSNGKLTAQVVHSARFKVATHVVGAIRGQVEELRKHFATSKVRLILFDSNAQTPYDTIKLDGDDAQAVALAKNELRKAIEGRVAKHQDKAIWSPSFIGNGSSFQAIKRIQKSTGAMVVREKRKSQLRLYGSEDACNAAEKALVKLINAEKATFNVIELDSAGLHWACNGGFRAISETLGDNIATFDIVSTPKRIIVTGTEENTRTVRTMVNTRSLQLGEERTAIEGDCSVCWTEPDHPVKTNCGHVYCLECFENMCTTTGIGNDDLLIACRGDLDKCGEVFTLQELKGHLSSSAFEDVLKTSFETFVRRRPSEFRYCGSADCNQIYKVTADARSFTCPECLTLTCTTCHSSHRGISCGDAKYLRSGGHEAFEKWKRENKVKECPKCTAPIEKIDGCNHMTCSLCETHICWVCLKTFKTGNLCYDHMNVAHSGIFPREYFI
jgi:hypothetical protein